TARTRETGAAVSAWGRVASMRIGSVGPGWGLFLRLGYACVPLRVPDTLLAHVLREPGMDGHQVRGRFHAPALEARHVLGDLNVRSVRLGELGNVFLDYLEHLVHILFRHFEADVEAVVERQQHDLVDTGVVALEDFGL